MQSVSSTPSLDLYSYPFCPHILLQISQLIFFQCVCVLYTQLVVKLVVICVCVHVFALLMFVCISLFCLKLRQMVICMDSNAEIKN